MKVLFLMIAYPDIRSNTNMYTDLTMEFLEHGHEVFVAAPGSGSTQILDEEGIMVLRIKTLPLFNTSFIKKGIANILLPYQYINAIRRHLRNKKFDLVITPTPPITFVNVAAWLKRRSESKVYLILRDIFPQNARDLGLIKNRLIFSYFRTKEKKLYRLADSIGCMSNGNIRFIKENNNDVNSEKLHLLPNWTRLHEVPDEGTSILQGYGFSYRFVAIFAGNFGIPQKIEFLIEVAEEASQNNQIGFVFVGDGTEKEKIEKMVVEKKLKNVLIIDNLPRQKYLKLLKECQAGIVTLSEKFTIPNIPSRTLSYWSLKKPVIAAIDRNTDFGDLLDSCSGGLWSYTGEVQDFLRNLDSLSNNPEAARKMGENGYNLILRELNPQSAYRKIIQSLG
jgi:glycosyltransferase involved in cell wall biosynthesis